MPEFIVDQKKGFLLKYVNSFTSDLMDVLLWSLEQALVYVALYWEEWQRRCFVQVCFIVAKELSIIACGANTFIAGAFRR